MDDAAGSREDSEGSRLDVAALASEAETTVERIRELVEIGAIKPAPDGTFERGDIVRARVVAAFEAEGFSLEQMAIAVRERAIALESVPLFYPEPSPRTGRTFAEFTSELGDRGRLIGPILAAMGLSPPAPEAPTRGTEERLLQALLDGWSTVDEEYTLRAARIFGDAARRAAESWVALFAEAISRPVESTYTSLEEVVPRLLRPAAILSPLSPKLLAWLVERHLERTMTDLNIDRIERRLEARGLLPNQPADPPAVAFVDVSGFTRLTVDRGDEYGARIAVRLGELADVVVRRRGGRVMKLLGDGVLLLFESPCDGVGAVAELSREMVKAGLPMAHAGLHAGPVVERDGDIYGSTVNMASRIANHAPAGTTLVSEAVVLQCPTLAGRFEPLGEVTVRGVADAVRLFRWKPVSGVPAS